MQVLQVGAQNQNTVGFPAAVAPSNEPPPTSGAVNCSAAGTAAGASSTGPGSASASAVVVAAASGAAVGSVVAGEPAVVGAGAWSGVSAVTASSERSEVVHAAAATARVRAAMASRCRGIERFTAGRVPTGLARGSRFRTGFADVLRRLDGR